ncbi:ABC transporter permease [Larkinella punicea]|uniref:ABC transporter permease n=1 Tax=Larkinella punicea TaxID=2315727 RepID=UPI0026DA4029|nr:ABC transporter permease [Larkinella punicea]
MKTGQGVPIPLAAALRTHYGSEFKHILLSSWTTRHVLTFGDAKFTKTGNFMSPEAPEVLSLKMLKGTQAGLKEPASILLSESTAKALFGDGDPMNKLVKIDNKLDVKVTGV